MVQGAPILRMRSAATAPIGATVELQRPTQSTQAHQQHLSSSAGLAESASEHASEQHNDEAQIQARGPVDAGEAILKGLTEGLDGAPLSPAAASVDAGLVYPQHGLPVDALSGSSSQLKRLKQSNEWLGVPRGHNSLPLVAEGQAPWLASPTRVASTQDSITDPEEARKALYRKRKREYKRNRYHRDPVYHVRKQRSNWEIEERKRLRVQFGDALSKDDIQHMARQKGVKRYAEDMRQAETRAAEQHIEEQAKARQAANQMFSRGSKQFKWLPGAATSLPASIPATQVTQGAKASSSSKDAVPSLPRQPHSPSTSISPQVPHERENVRQDTSASAPSGSPTPPASELTPLQHKLLELFGSIDLP